MWLCIAYRRSICKWSQSYRLVSSSREIQSLNAWESQRTQSMVAWRLKHFRLSRSTKSIGYSHRIHFKKRKNYQKNNQQSSCGSRNVQKCHSFLFGVFSRRSYSLFGHIANLISRKHYARVQNLQVFRFHWVQFSSRFSNLLQCRLFFFLI